MIANIAGLSPVEAGLALLPGLLAMIVAGLVVVPIARRVRPRMLVPVALGLSAAGYLVIALGANTGSIAPIIIAFVLLGVGIGAAETVSNEPFAPAGFRFVGGMAHLAPIAWWLDSRRPSRASRSAMRASHH